MIGPKRNYETGLRLGKPYPTADSQMACGMHCSVDGKGNGFVNRYKHFIVTALVQETPR